MVALRGPGVQCGGRALREDTRDQEATTEICWGLDMGTQPLPSTHQRKQGQG